MLFVALPNLQFQSVGISLKKYNDSSIVRVFFLTNSLEKELAVACVCSSLY